MNSRFCLLLFLVCAVSAVYGFGNKEKDEAPAAEPVISVSLFGNNSGSVPAVESGSTVRVTGVVRLVGSEPFTQLVVSNDDGSWFIDRDEMSLLHNLQHRTVTVEGTAAVTEITRGGGSISAGTRLDLKDIKLISVD